MRTPTRDKRVWEPDADPHRLHLITASSWKPAQVNLQLYGLVQVYLASVIGGLGLMQQLAEVHQASLNSTLPRGKSGGKDLSHLLTHKYFFWLCPL